MSRAYLVLSLGTIALGLVHIAATFRIFPRLSGAAVWFAGAGLAIILTGALNLLRRIYGEAALGVRIVCLVANVVMTAFAALAGYAGRASAAEFLIVVGLVGGTTVFSVLPGAQRPIGGLPTKA